jgi:hypothetical protein
VTTVIHDRRIEVPAPADLADGTEVILTIRHDWSELHYVVCAKPWSVLFVTTDSIRVDSGQQAGLIRSHLVL